MIPSSGRSPRLLLRFIVLTALGLGLAATLIVVLVRKDSTRQGERHALEQARYAAEAVLEPELRAGDLERPVSPGRRVQLDRLFEQRVLLEGTTAATLYDPSGRRTYETDGSRGPAHLDPSLLRDVLEGTAIADLARSGDEATPVLRSYVPVALGSEGASGVALLEHDYARIEAAAKRSAWVIAGVLEGILLLLVLTLGPVLVRVSRRIERHARQLEHMSIHDDLTGLPNVRALRNEGERLARSKRPTAVVVVEVDEFSEITDALRPGSGEDLLVQIGERLTHALPDAHVVARLEQAQFGVLVPAAYEEHVAAFGERISSALVEPVVVSGIRIAVIARIGAALLREHGPDFETALRNARVALSAAKLEGRFDPLVYDPDLMQSDPTRLAFAAELREALDSGRLLLHYQPQADLATKQIRGVEALLRWQHPVHGLLPAREFISAAERSGLTRELRRFVFESAARQWREWCAIGINLELAVNVSAVDLLDTALPDEIADLLDRHGIPPWNLVLEVTERLPVGVERRVRGVLEALSGTGVRIAIDDFGTGSWSLATLRTIPVHQVKLDPHLLAGAPGDAGAEAVVAGSIEIAHGVGATVVAEGVESREQWRFLYMLACDVAQGHFVGGPAPADEITALLERHQPVPVTA